MTGGQRRRIGLARGLGLILGIFLGLAGPAHAADLQLRPVLQLGHDTPPRVAAWLPDNRYFASAGDSDVIVWDADAGRVVSRQLVPRGAAARFAVTDIDAVGASIRLRGVVTTPSAEGAGEESRCQTLRFDPEGLKPAVAESITAGPCPPAERPPSQRAGNGRSWRFAGNDIVILPGPAGGPAVRLTNLPRDQFTAGAVSPDAQFVGQIATVGAGAGVATRVSARSLRLGQVFADRRFPGAYGRIQWLDEGRYMLSPWPVDVMDPCRKGVPPDTLVVVAATGEVVDRVPTLRQMALLGTAGAMVGIGRSPCLDAPGATGIAVRLPGQPWRHLPVEAMAGRDVFKLAARPDGSAIAVLSAVRRRSAQDEFVGWRILLIPLNAALAPGKAQLLPMRFDDPDNDLEGGAYLWGFGIGRDGATLVVGADESVYCFDTATGGLVRALTLAAEGIPDFYSADRTMVLVGWQARTLVEVHDLATGGVSGFEANNLNSAGILAGRNLLWSVGNDGTTRFYDQRTRRRILTSFRLPDGGFFTIDSEDRYDTNQGADSATIRWQLSDRPFESLPPQMFMRDRYEPDLLPRRLDCTTAGTCDRVFPALPAIAAVNRSLPSARIVSVEAGPRPGTALVRLEARPGLGSDGTPSGLRDVRLLRDNRLVPASVDTDRIGADGVLRQAFVVAVPSRGAPVTFTAYAFNDEQRKGETSDPVRFTPPRLDRPRRAYVLTIGIDAYDIPGRNLGFAAADARALAGRLQRIDGFEVHRLTLTSDAGGNLARKDLLRAAFGLVSGAPGHWARTLAAAGVDPAGFGPATPDDIVIISWSGHGLVLDQDGGGRVPARRSFALLPSDVRQPSPFEPLDPASLVSADDLADWLRPLDAGETAFIIDACHSGASVAANGFKPGPMGDRTLGQLAFDKGIRILAATQADDVAREESQRGLGLLTATLIDSGLGGQAPGTEDGWIRLDAVLRHAAAALPERMAREQAARAAQAPPPLLIPDSGYVPPPRPQVPAVFDFTGQASPAWLAARQP